MRTPSNNNPNLRNNLATHGAVAQNKETFTATSGRNGNGVQPGGKSITTGARAQWSLGPSGRVPPRAFELHERERHRFRVFACAVPLAGDPVAEIQCIGAGLFNATYAAKESEFTMAISAGQLEVERLATDRSRLAAALVNIPATVETETAEPRWPRPFSVKCWGLVVFLICFCLSSAGAVTNIVTLLLPFTQSLPAALMVSFVWTLLAVAAKKGINAVPGRLRVISYWAVAVVGSVGAVLWLTGLITVYGGGVNLSNLVGSGALVPSRTLSFIGQLLAEFCVGVACLCGVLGALSFERRTELNDNRRRVSEAIAQVDRELDWAMGAVGKAEGNLAELKASREAFVAEGVAIVRLRQANTILIAQNERLISENRRLLDQVGE